MVLEETWLPALEKASKQLIEDLLAGNAPETQDVMVPLKVPKTLYEAILEVGGGQGVDPVLIIAQMASYGLQEAIKSQVQVPESPFDEMKKMGLDMSQFEQTINRLKDVLGSIQEMEEELDVRDPTKNTE